MAAIVIGDKAKCNSVINFTFLTTKIDKRAAKEKENDEKPSSIRTSIKFRNENPTLQCAFSSITKMKRHIKMEAI